MRDSLASLLILIGALLTFPATLAVWEQRVLTDRDAFIELGKEILSDPAVQDRVTERIIEETDVVAAANGYSFPGGVLGNIARGQTENLTRAVVRELPESIIGEQALVATHEALLAVIDDDSELLEASNDEVRVNFRPVVEQVLGTFETVIPGFPDLVLPPGTGELVIVQEKDVSLAFQAARWFDGAAWYIALVPVVFIATGLFVASNRQAALFLTGVAIIVAAGLRILFYQGPLQRIVADSVVDDPAVRPAARGVYDAIAASLISQDMLLLVAGLALVIMSIVLWGLKRVGV